MNFFFFFFQKLVYLKEFLKSILSQIDQLLPSNEHQTLLDRYSMFKKDFIIPKDKLKIIFDTAIQEARRRTKLKMQVSLLDKN